MRCFGPRRRQVESVKQNSSLAHGRMDMTGHEWEMHKAAALEDQLRWALVSLSPSLSFSNAAL